MDSLVGWRERGGDDRSCGGSSGGCASMWLSAAGGGAEGGAGGTVGGTAAANSAAGVALIIAGTAASAVVSLCGLAMLSENRWSRFSRCALSVQPASRAARKAAAAWACDGQPQMRCKERPGVYCSRKHSWKWRSRP